MRPREREGVGGSERRGCMGGWIETHGAFAFAFEKDLALPSPRADSASALAAHDDSSMLYAYTAPQWQSRES